MQQIPNQPLELKCTILLSSDRKLPVTLFPLPSHSWEAPVDLLEGFVNKRRGEFFPIRITGGAEMLLPLHECIVFELTREEEEELLSLHPEMSRETVSRSAFHVASYARVLLTLRTGRRIQGALWFYDFTPKTKRNLMDALNEGTRYLTLHTRSKTLFVRSDSILRAEVMPSPREAAPRPDESQHEQAGLVDSTLDFGSGQSREPVDPYSGKRIFESSPNQTPLPQESLSSIFLRPDFSGEFSVSPLAPSKELPRPRPEDLE